MSLSLYIYTYIYIYMHTHIERDRDTYTYLTYPASLSLSISISISIYLSMYIYIYICICYTQIWHTCVCVGVCVYVHTPYREAGSAPRSSSLLSSVVSRPDSGQLSWEERPLATLPSDRKGHPRKEIHRDPGLLIVHSKLYVITSYIISMCMMSIECLLLLKQLRLSKWVHIYSCIHIHVHMQINVNNNIYVYIYI